MVSQEMWYKPLLAVELATLDRVIEKRHFLAQNGLKVAILLRMDKR